MTTGAHAPGRWSSRRDPRARRPARGSTPIRRAGCARERLSRSGDRKRHRLSGSGPPVHAPDGLRKVTPGRRPRASQGDIMRKGRIAAFAASTSLIAAAAGAQTFELDEIVVSGGLTPAPAPALGRAVTVITAETIEETGAVHAADVLRGMPGVS